MTTLIIALDAKDARLIVSDQGMVATWEYGHDFSSELLKAIDTVIQSSPDIGRIALSYTNPRSGVIRTTVVVSSLFAYTRNIPLVEIPYASDPSVLLEAADKGQPIRLVQPHYTAQGK